MQSPQLSFIIVSYNVKELLEECINSVLKFCPFSFEIIVVDNASVDGTREMLANKFPQVIADFSNLNLGFSAGNNHGFSLAKGETIILMNPDAALVDDCISPLYRFLENNPESIVAPALINSDLSYQVSAWKFPNPAQHLVTAFFLNRLVNLTEYAINPSAKEITVDFVSGAFMMMRAETYRKLNGLDENLFWMDDVDLCKRLQISGGKVWYLPGYRVMHHIGQSGKKNQRVVISNQILSKLKYYQKHRQYSYLFLSWFIFLVHILIRLPLFLLFSAFGTRFYLRLDGYFFTLIKLFQFIFVKRIPVT